MKILGNLFFLMWLVGWSGAAAARNPFDLQHRLAPEALAEPGNRFDVVPHLAPAAARVMEQPGQLDDRVYLSLPKGKGLEGRGLLAVLSLALVFMTFVVATHRSVMVRVWRAFLNETDLKIAQRESQGFTGIVPYYLVYANFLINFGIFIFLIVNALGSMAHQNLPALMLCVLLAVGLFLVKHLVLRALGGIFGIEELYRYNFQIIVFNCVLGIFLVPFNFLITFLLDYKEFLLFWVGALTLIFYGYRAFRALVIGSKYLFEYRFHFLLYLCTVEIAPLLLLIKVFSLQGFLFSL